MDVKLESLSLPPKSRWEAVLTVTPVVLTVLGTLLAGLSSSEMTLAQYYRTLAAQSQAKASDQWAFFQAKRIRGTSLELFVKQLPLLAQPADAPVEFAAATRLLLKRLHQANAAADKLQEAILQSRDSLNERDGAWLAGHGSNLVDRSREFVQEADGLEERLAVAASNSSAPRNLKPPANLPAARPLDAMVQQALTDLAAGKAAPALEADLLAVTPSSLQTAIVTAEDDVRALEAALLPAHVQLRAMAQLVEAEVALVPAYFLRVRYVEDAVAELRPLDGKNLTAVQQALVEVNRAGQDAVVAAEQLRNRMNFLEQFYLARSYRLEADRNQQLAQLYELQVRQNGGLAERHRNRSRSFFYGMLCAQAGVTISSLALAARQKNLLWGLAGAAGLTALIFSLYVYLFV